MWFTKIHFRMIEWLLFDFRRHCFIYGTWMLWLFWLIGWAAAVSVADFYVETRKNLEDQIRVSEHDYDKYLLFLSILISKQKENLRQYWTFFLLCECLENTTNTWLTFYIVLRPSFRLEEMLGLF